MTSSKPFIREELNAIFKKSQKYPDRVTSRENSTLEFKENFGWKSLASYLKTCAAYANTKGGYIVFGITNCPHRLQGLSSTSLEAFEKIDPEKLTTNFNTHFSPEIIWDIHQHEYMGKTFGLLYVHEGTEKPIICKKDAGNELREGDIYYRYRGRTERIKFPELRQILETNRENEQLLWMRQIEKMAKIGVRNTGLFDLNTGTVSGTHGAFLIEESLLSQLSFIREGEFSEIKGNPTLKLIGNVEIIDSQFPVIGGKSAFRTKSIRLSDIVLAFLKHEKLNNPKDYIIQICFERTGYLPVYYFIHNAKLNIQNTIDLVEQVISRSPAKQKLIERLEKNKKENLSFSDKGIPSYKKRQDFISQLISEQIECSRFGEGSELKYFLDAIRMLSPEQIRQHSEYLRELLRNCFNKHYTSAPSTIVDHLRRAICWLDMSLYGAV